MIPIFGSKYQCPVFLHLLWTLFRTVAGNPKEVREIEQFANKNPLIVVMLLWISLGIFSALVFVVFANISADIHQLYDGCTASTAYYKYIMKFRFGPYSRNFSLKTNYVMIDLMDAQSLFITRFAIPPSWLRKATRKPTPKYPKMKIAKFEFNRSRPLPQISYLRIAHDCYTPYGEVLEVYSMEIKDLATNTITHVPIFHKILALGPDAGETRQNYPATKPFVAKPGQDDMFQEGIAPYITIPEMSIFVFLYVNLCVLFTLLIPTPLKIHSFKTMITNSFVSSLVALLCSLTALTFYKLQIKTRYVSAYGTGAWSVVRTIYFATILLLAFTIGSAGGFLATLSVVSERAIQNWTAAIVFTVIILLLYGPFLYLAMDFIGFVEVRRIKEVKDIDFATMVTQTEPEMEEPKKDRKKTESMLTLKTSKSSEKERDFKMSGGGGGKGQNRILSTAPPMWQQQERQQRQTTGQEQGPQPKVGKGFSLKKSATPEWAVLKRPKSKIEANNSRPVKTSPTFSRSSLVTSQMSNRY